MRLNALSCDRVRGGKFLKYGAEFNQSKTVNFRFETAFCLLGRDWFGRVRRLIQSLRILFLDDVDDLRAEAVDKHLHAVAFDNRTDAGWCAGQDYVACGKLKIFGKIGNHLGDFPNHLV